MIRNLILLTAGLLFIAITAMPAQSFQWTGYSTGTGAVGVAVTGRGIDNDLFGNRYIVGDFNKTIVFDGDSLSSMGNSSDIFIAKYDSSGVFQWAVSAGGTLNDWAGAIAVDDSGNCYITGTYQGIAWFDTVSIVSFDNLEDVFVAKYNRDGVFQWVGRIGSQVDDNGQGIAVNQRGEVFVTGDYRIFAYFYDAGSPVPSDTLFSVTAVNSDIFTACYSSGGGLLWARSAGGSSGESGNSVATDRFGNCFVTGYFYETAFFEGQSLVSDGGQDIFVAKYHRSGNLLQAWQIGSPGNEEAYAISIDSSDYIYLAGNVANTLTLGSDTLNWVNSGGAFLAKFDGDMTPVWAREPVSFNFTGIGFRSIDVSASGQCYVAGSFNGARAIFGNDTLRTAPGTEEMLTAHYTSDGDIVWARQAGETTASEIGYGVNVASNDKAYVTGSYTGYAIFGNDTLDNGPGVFLSKFATENSPMAIEPTPPAAQSFVLKQNYPNPFNPQTTIEFYLPAASLVTLEIYDILGRRVETPYRASLRAGTHKIIWQASDAAGRSVASGFYVYRVTVTDVAGNAARRYSLSKKMLLMR